MSVLLPAPFSPINASVSPAAERSEASRNGDRAAVALERPAIESRSTSRYCLTLSSVMSWVGT